MSRRKSDPGPTLPLSTPPADKLYTRRGRRSIYAELKHQGKAFRRSTGTRMKSAAEQWLALARRELNRTGTLPAAPSHAREGGC